MQDSLVFLILGVDRLRKDPFIYEETRENCHTVVRAVLSWGVCLMNFLFYFEK